MKKLIFFAVSVSLAITLCSTSSFAVDLSKAGAPGYGDVSNINVALRLMEGRGSVLRSGKDIRLTYRVTEDAYVIIYNIDSEGYINLLYPHDGKLKKAEKYTVYSLPERGSGVELKTGSKTGVEYIHALAVRDIRDIDSQELYFLSQNNRFSREKRFRTDMDPYLTMNRIDETIIKDIEDNLPAADQTYFFVNERVDFPDYICDDGCGDVAIERNFYDQSLEYPYPPLYNIVKNEEKEYYSNDEYYGDNLSGDWDDEVLGYDDTDIHLTLNLGFGGHRYYDPFWGYYPYDHYYPWYSYNYDPYYYGWTIGIGGMWWGVYDPWDYYYGYGYRHPFMFWRYPHTGYYYTYHPDWYHGRSRSVYSGRSFRRSRLDYHASLKKVKTRDTIKRSRLARTRARTLTAEKIGNSRISSALSSRTVRNRRDIRSSSLRKYTPRTRTVYTGKARSVNRGNTRAGTARSRSSRSSTSRSIRNLRRKSSSSDRPVNNNRSRSVRTNRTKRTSPAKRSSTRSSSSSKKSRSSSARKSSTRSRSSSSRSRSSSTRSRSTSKRSSSASKTRSRSSSGSSRSSSKSSRSSSKRSSSKSKRSSGQR
ncbi:MAG: DUF4384 domain-containing protein [Candidatus Krumholzibacteriales bacterium]